MGKPGGVLPYVQSPQGEPSAKRDGHEADEGAASIYAAYQPAHHANDWTV